jgi:hypothetical protein
MPPASQTKRSTSARPACAGITDDVAAHLALVGARAASQQRVDVGKHRPPSSFAERPSSRVGAASDRLKHEDHNASPVRCCGWFGHAPTFQANGVPDRGDETVGLCSPAPDGKRPAAAGACVSASVCPASACTVIPPICFGHIDRRELRRRVGPKRAEDFGLGASVNPTGACAAFCWGDWTPLELFVASVRGWGSWRWGQLENSQST